MTRNDRREIARTARTLRHLIREAPKEPACLREAMRAVLRDMVRAARKCPKQFKRRARKTCRTERN